MHPHRRNAKNRNTTSTDNNSNSNIHPSNNHNRNNNNNNRRHHGKRNNRGQHHRDHDFDQDEFFDDSPTPVKKEAPKISVKHMPEDFQALYSQHEHIVEKIKLIDTRLAFANSDPLNQYKMDLMKEDMQLICQMTDQLVQS